MIMMMMIMMMMMMMMVVVVGDDDNDNDDGGGDDADSIAVAADDDDDDDDDGGDGHKRGRRLRQPNSSYHNPSNLSLNSLGSLIIILSQYDRFLSHVIPEWTTTLTLQLKRR